MASASIILPRKPGDKLREKALEIGYLPEELGVEFVRRCLNEKLDPEGLMEHYQTLSEKYLGEAKELLKERYLVQASAKLWGASALAVKGVAARRGQQLEKHGALWGFVNTLAKESGDKDFVRFFHVANNLHKNFYENEMPEETIEISAEDVEKLITKLKEVK